MNIAIFTHNYPKNISDRKDAGFFVHDFAEELKKRHKVLIFCPDYGNTQKFGNWNIFNPLNLFNFCKNIIYGTNEAFKFVQKNKIDYILCAWAIPSGIYALFTKIKFKIPYGIWYLGSDLNIYSKIPVLNIIISYISSHADNLFANSYALKNIVEKKYHLKCLMLPAVTNVLNIKSKDIILNKDKINLLYVGRLEKVKGPDLLLKALNVVKNDLNYNLLMIGDGTMRNKLNDYVNINNLNHNIKFLGNKNLEELSGYMKASDLLILPSRNESLPLVILESANYKLPILASDVGDCKYILDQYKIGIVFEKENTLQLAFILKSLLKSKDFLKIKQHGKFTELIADYNLNESIKTFLNTIS